MTAVILTKLDSIGGFVCQLVACCRRVLRARRSQVALRQSRAVKGASPQVQQVHRSAVLMDATVLRLWRCSNIYLFVWRFCSPTPVVQCFLAGLTALRHKRLFILIHYFQLSRYLLTIENAIISIIYEGLLHISFASQIISKQPNMQSHSSQVGNWNTYLPIRAYILNVWYGQQHPNMYNIYWENGRLHYSYMTIIKIMVLSRRYYRQADTGMSQLVGIMFPTRP